MSRGTTTGVEFALTTEERRLLREVIDMHGERKAADRLCVSRTTLLRAATGLPIRRGSAALLRLQLENVGP